jgi:hypothetical protein
MCTYLQLGDVDVLFIQLNIFVQPVIKRAFVSAFTGIRCALCLTSSLHTTTT